MDIEAFRENAQSMVDYICEYMTTLGERPVFPSITPGYLPERLPKTAPEEGESWADIMRDVEDHIMPGVTHWQHPRFHAYFPAGNSYPSILGDMLSAGLGCMASTWASSPAASELEVLVLDWLRDMFGLPEHFNNSSGIGAGTLQGSASDSILVSMLAARYHKIQEVRSQHPELEEGQILQRLVGYCSSLAHCSVDKAGMFCLTRIRQLEPDKGLALRGDALLHAIEEDRQKGLIPFFAACTLGSTACCSFDNLDEMGRVCEAEGLRLHVDSAYGGNAFICPEFRHHLKGVERAFSMNFNPNKWMLINFDCSVLWVADKKAFLTAFWRNKLEADGEVLDLHHFSIPEERRFRALKMWCTIRNYGVEGLQHYVREHTRLAKYFDRLVRTDARFEVVAETHTGLACFRLRGSNALSEWLMSAINQDGRIHMVPATVGHSFIIRFALCAENARERDVRYAWAVVKDCARPILAALTCARRWRQKAARVVPKQFRKKGNMEQAARMARRQARHAGARTIIE